MVKIEKDLHTTLLNIINQNKYTCLKLNNENIKQILRDNSFIYSLKVKDILNMIDDLKTEFNFNAKEVQKQIKNLVESNENTIFFENFYKLDDRQLLIVVPLKQMVVLLNNNFFILKNADVFNEKKIESIQIFEKAIQENSLIYSSLSFCCKKNINQYIHSNCLNIGFQELYCRSVHQSEFLIALKQTEKYIKNSTKFIPLLVYEKRKYDYVL